MVLPPLGQEQRLDVESKIYKDENFVININRKGKLKPTKCTYLTLYNKSTILLRLDIDGPAHMNPDGNVIPCPHIHIYREGFDDKWAFPLENEIKTDTSDLLSVLIDFLEYNNIENIPTAFSRTLF
ncbi:hypothetical protein ERY13_07550 [Paenibacillus mucilaginosus]|nr:hypothetical protein ERY13_07550 [Paenibacillus mucilaginosus]